MSEKCKHCGGEIGPDITDRPMCYGCGPVEMVPRERPEYEARSFVDPSEAWEAEPDVYVDRSEASNVRNP